MQLYFKADLKTKHSKKWKGKKQAALYFLMDT